MPTKTKRTKKVKSNANKVPKNPVNIQKQLKKKQPLANNFNTYAPYQVVPSYYSQHGSNMWA